MDFSLKNMILTAVLVLSVLGDGWGLCTQEAVENCIAPMMVHNLDEEAGIVPAFSESEMRDICRTFDGVEACLKPIRPHCDLLDQVVYLGIEKSYSYICDDNLKEYSKHRECLGTPEIHSEGRRCNESLTRQLNSIDNRATTADRHDRICLYSNDYFDCVENTVAQYCSNEAATWQRGLDEQILGPLLGLINCDYSKYEKKGLNVPLLAAIICVVIGLLLVAVMIAIYFGMRKKKAPPRERRQHRTRTDGTGDGANAVPPYVIYNNGMSSVHRDPAASPVDIANGTYVPSLIPPPYKEKDDVPAYSETGGVGVYPEQGAVGGAPGQAPPLEDKKMYSEPPPSYTTDYGYVDGHTNQAYTADYVKLT